MRIRMSPGKTFLLLATMITGLTTSATEPACELTDSIVSVDCTNIYNKILSVDNVAPGLKVAYNASHLEHGDDCEDKLQITLNLVHVLTDEVVPFHSVNIVLKVHVNPKKKKNETDGDSSITTYAGFARGRFGESVNCFKPENSIILISYEKNQWTSGGEGLNTTTVTVVGVPTDGIVLTFVQFKLSNGSVAQEIIYLENSPMDLELSSGPESEILDLNYEEEEYEERVLSYFDESTPHGREVRSLSEARQIQRSNMSLTALRRGHVRYTGHDGSGRKHRKTLHTIESGETGQKFSLVELRRGHHRFHNESSHGMRHLGRGTQQHNGYDLLEIKRGKVRWHPNRAGSRSLSAIHHASHNDSDFSLETLRRGHVRYHPSSPGGKTRKKIDLRSQKSDQATNMTEDPLQLIDLRRGHVRHNKAPRMHSRTVVIPSGEQREVLGNFRLLDFRRGHRNFAPKTANSRSLTVHRKFGDTAPSAYNASLVQLRRGPKHLTRQDHLALKRSRGHRGAIDENEASLSFQDTGINAESRKAQNEVRSMANVKEASIEHDTNMGENLPEPTEGITKAHVERMGVDYIPKVEMIYSGCGKQYSCFHHPKNCHLKKNCLVASSWRTDGTGRIHVVLLARNNHYVAVAFSKDDNMGNDPAVHCKRIPGTDRVAIWKSYNVPGSTPHERLNVVETRNQTDVEPISGAVYQGIITCDFTFPVKMDSDQGDLTDFSKEKMYIMLAIGMNNMEPDGAGSISYHRYSLVSSSSVSLVSSSRKIVTDTTHYGNGIHIGFSIIVYTLFMPLGIIMSRYCQEVYQSVFVLGYPVWMVIHVVCQCLAVFCNIVVALSAYIGRSGGAYTSGTSAYHAVIGTAITILSVVNLSIGFFVHIKRKNFSEPLGPLQLKLHLAHFIIGHIIFILGALELIRGPYIRKSRTACGFSVIAGFWLLFYVFANLLLMFNTDYLRRLQKVKEPTSRSFFGPAIHLNLWADKEEFNSRRDILIFMYFLCPLFTVALYATYWMSSNDCTEASVGYIY